MKWFTRSQFALSAISAAAVLLASAPPAAAQFGGPGGGPPGPPRETAPIDPTGQWVSIVTEDWRFRMVTPAKGDYPGLPLTSDAQAVAEEWDPAEVEAEGNECKAYGAAAIMRVPGRIRISWRDDSTLEVRTDAGSQTRVFHFGEAPEPPAEHTWQGVSRAEWIRHGGGFGQPAANGTLNVVTTHMRPGFIRKNGVPYGADAVVTEYFDLLNQPDGSQWLVVKTIVEDPQYLTRPVITSSNFRKENDRSGWDPRPCTAD